MKDIGIKEIRNSIRKGSLERGITWKVTFRDWVILESYGAVVVLGREVLRIWSTVQNLHQ